jgi:hypothetical protein
VTAKVYHKTLLYGMYNRTCKWIGKFACQNLQTVDYLLPVIRISGQVESTSSLLIGVLCVIMQVVCRCLQHDFILGYKQQYKWFFLFGVITIKQSKLCLLICTFITYTYKRSLFVRSVT